jgi:hypothetical protein
MTREAAIKFLREAAEYFERRPTNGEDSAHWANVYNAKNCRDIADLLSGEAREAA